MLLEDCSTEAAWLWAWSETCSTLAVSSSTEAEVSSRVEAWFWAPEESCWAEEEISSLEEATCSAAWRICRIMSFSRSTMRFSASLSVPSSSRRRMSSRRVKSPPATTCA